MGPKISVIVPVYKVEPYLDQCVESVVNQTYRDLEIILVDDGSPDACPAMCDAWAARDGRIRVIHTSNGGAARARNVGLRQARGEYIGFADSDDILHPEMYQKLLHALEETESDIAECSYTVFQNDDMAFSEGDAGEISRYTPEEAMYLHVADRFFRQIIWNKLYRRVCIQEPFVEGKLIDDEFWTYRALGRAKSLARTDETLYGYRQQPESVMHRRFSAARLQALEAKRQRLLYLEERFPKVLPQARCNYYFTALYLYQMSLRHLSGEEREKAERTIKSALCGVPCGAREIAEARGMSRLWLFGAAVSLRATALVRNCLNKGF